MIRLRTFWVAVIAICVVAFGCEKSPEERYKELEKQELAKKERYDSLFFEIYLGMTNREFGQYCFDEHLNGKFMQGGKKSGSWVEAKLPTELAFPAAINFFPEYENNRIAKMNASIYYLDSVSFPEGTFSDDSLLNDVLNYLDEGYGEGHFKIKSPYTYTDDVYVKIKGNRRITISLDKIGHMVNLWFVDMKKEEFE